MSEILEDISSTKTLSNNILQKYYLELEDDVHLTQMNLHDRNLRCSSIRTKWLMYLLKEKENLKKIKKTKDLLKASLLNTQTLDDKRSILRQKNEDNILSENEQLIKLNNGIEILNETIDFLTLAQNILNDFGYNIKNMIELIKLEQI